MDPLAWLMGFEGVPSAFAAARDGVDALLRDRGLRRTTPQDTSMALLLGAQASAELAGSASSLEDLEHGAGDDVAHAAVRVSTELLGLLPVLRTAPLQAFARLHTLAAGGSPSAGRPRDAEAAQRLRTLAETLRATEVPAMVQAALAHAEIITVLPFGSHDGLVARAVERLLLVERGVDPASVLVPEAGHRDLRAEYESNLRGYRDGGRAGVHSWLLYAAEAYPVGVENSPLAPRNRRTGT